MDCQGHQVKIQMAENMNLDKEEEDLRRLENEEVRVKMRGAVHRPGL